MGNNRAGLDSRLNFQENAGHGKQIPMSVVYFSTSRSKLRGNLATKINLACSIFENSCENLVTALYLDKIVVNEL